MCPTSKGPPAEFAFHASVPFGTTTPDVKSDPQEADIETRLPMADAVDIESKSKGRAVVKSVWASAAGSSRT